MLILENDKLKIEVLIKGAELNSIYSKETKLEYLWSGDPEVWNKKSPVLFPIVGRLKQNTFYYKNKAYSLNRHGFAREMAFEVTSQSLTSLTMTLISNDTTLADYPFPFRFEIIYSLDSDNIHVTYKVMNTGEDNMYFSVGGHPAFRIPFEEDLFYDDYYFEFDQIEDAYRWEVSREGLIEPVTIPFMINSNVLPLTKELFRNDAVVFKYLNSTKVKLKSDKSKHGIEFSFPRFPFLALWAAPNADFVCIEPWCGIADSTTGDQQLINKEGINLLTPDQVFERTWSVKPF